MPQDSISCTPSFFHGYNYVAVFRIYKNKLMCAERCTFILTLAHMMWPPSGREIKNKFLHSIIVVQWNTSTLTFFECCHEIVTIVSCHVSKWRTLASHARDFVIWKRKVTNNILLHPNKGSLLFQHQLALNVFFVLENSYLLCFDYCHFTHVSFKCLLNLSFDFMRCVVR